MKAILLTLMAALVIPGCAANGLLKTSSSAITAPVSALVKRSRPRPVSKILCLWEAAEGQGLDEKPSRGFAGQILLFGYGSSSPIQSDGEVRIYQYTNFDADAEDPQPQHVFRFDSGAWDAHRVEGTLGDTYNVFIPYVKKDKSHAVCGLRVEVEAKDGTVVSSQFTEIKLSSKTTSQPAAALRRNIVQQSQTGIRQAGGTLPSAQPQRKLESTTIALPSRTP